jgi:hypothetical protein
LWDLLSLTLRVRVVGFAGNIFSLACINGRIFVGCQDTTIKVASFAPPSAPLHPSHPLTRRCLCVCGCVCVVSCVLCRVVRRQSIDVERLLERLVNEAPPAQPVTVTLALLSTWGEGILATTNDHRGYVYALTTTPRYLISGSGDGTVKVCRVCVSCVCRVSCVSCVW